MDFLNQKEILTILITIAVGVVIRLIYDFWVKPLFKKKDTVYTPKQIKALIKKSSDSEEHFQLLLEWLKNHPTPLLRDTYQKLKTFDHQGLTEEDESSKENLLKQIKKLQK